MNLLFGSAKDNNQTLSLNNHYIHSPYSPIKEAERFVSLLASVECDLILLIEPGLPYTLPFLKKKYSRAKIGIIRLIKDFNAYNSDWDFVFEYKNAQALENTLLSTFTEEELLCSQLLDWTPSKNLFQVENLQIWQSYKKVLEHCRTILVTRQYFEKKWIINTCNYIKYLINDYSIINKSSKPILIISSGPSLNNVIKELSQFQEKCFIICLSSAIKVLLSKNIKPDLILTTDGGYYAGQHLKQLFNSENPIIAAPCEAFIQKQLLEKLNIIPCTYSEGISKKMLEACNINAITLERNGTVSGTALKLALQLTDNNIYCLGMDLAPGKASQHTEPNELEINNSIKDFRINNKETRQTKARFNSQSLSIYRNWFENQSGLKNKIFRVIENQEKLGEIENINYSDFINLMISTNDSFQDKSIFKKQKDYSDNYRIQKIKSLKLFIKNNSSSEEWKKQIFPVDFISIKHAKNQEEKELLLQKLEEKNQKLLNKIGKLLN